MSFSDAKSKFPNHMKAAETNSFCVSLQIEKSDAVEIINNSDKVYLSYHWFNDDMSEYKWDNNRVPILSTPNQGYFTATLDVVAPNTSGVYILQLDIVEEGIRWFSSSGLLDPDSINIKVERNPIGIIKYKIKQAFERSPIHYHRLHAFYLTLSARNQLRKYKNYGKGKRCFIIGNGPSLNGIDITLLKDEVTFGVNAIFLLYDAMGFEPTFYLVEDSLVMEDRCGDIDTRVISSTKIFPTAYKKYLQNHENTYFVEFFNIFDYKDFPHFSKHPTKYCWNGGTVSYFCMQMAYYFGFSEVYLVGFDHSYTIPKSALVDGYTITSTEDDVNHFAPNYFGKGYRWHDPLVHRMEISYKKARNIFEKSGRKIFNATKGGNLEVFPRVEYESLFGDLG